MSTFGLSAIHISPPCQVRSVAQRSSLVVLLASSTSSYRFLQRTCISTCVFAVPASCMLINCDYLY